ncbi:MAG: hypothetical protein DLM53_10050 [Candidatus Eremiobacter antarcticus]|nr:hypothetical protein [Candidatus Eremiobacteraeota bacterium]MBC5807188.1 hypothetical protein [Candidatus Eremiobacteraeota bacterium]PZR60987.1 MAG: hypothetical protein DLM53_10050 [Candidatus Eremiobacter sp. RRmetagenome_bin22]
MVRQPLLRSAIVAGMLSAFVCVATVDYGQTEPLGRRAGVTVGARTTLPQPMARHNLTSALRFFQSSDTRLGINLPELGPQPSDAIVFVDAMKQAAPWSSLRPLRTDADGNITSLAPGQTAQTSIVTKQAYPPGDYTLLYDGRGRISVSGATLVQNSPGRMVARLSPARHSIYLQLSAVDPSDYVRNVRLILPGFEATYATHPFHPTFVAALQRFHVLRFKGWERADGYAASATWSNRPTVSRLTQAGPDGVAPEYLIALANATGDDPWFALPLGATDYYIAQFARLVHASLDPRLHPIFEYGHEVWRIGSLGNGYAQMAGRNFRLSNDPQTAALHWYSLRSTQAFNIIERNFGFDVRRVVRVLSGPLGAAGSAQAAVDREILGFANAAGSADAFAVAAQGAAGDQSPANAGPGNRFTRMYALQQNNVVNAASYASALLSTATMLGGPHLSLFAYQGPSTAAGPARNALEALQAAQRTRLSFGASLESWHAGGGGLFVANFDESVDQAMRSGMQQYAARHPYAHLAPLAGRTFVAPPIPNFTANDRRTAANAPTTAPTPQSAFARQQQLRAAYFARTLAMSAGATLTYHPGTVAAPSQLFYTVPGESGAISRQMDPTAIGSLTNETLTYLTSTQTSNWGWVSGPNEPQMTAWPATTYVVSLNVTQPNGSLQIQQVRVFRVDSTGGPQYTGLATVGALKGLTQSLGAAGILTFTVPGSAQNANASDRLAVKFDVRNFSSTTQSFSYDAGAGALSNLNTNFAASPPPSPSPTPSPSPSPPIGSIFHPGTAAAPSQLFYTVPGESGAVSRQMDPTAVGALTNETITYLASTQSSSWGWVSGPNEPQLTAWPATTYVVKLNVTQPNASLQIQQVRIFRVDSTGGPQYTGLATVGALKGLTQSLGAAGVLTFTIPGSPQNANASDRLAVKFDVRNFASTTQSFSYDAGAGTLSSLNTGFSAGSIPDITTFHVDNARTGWNAQEVTLTATNVASTRFGQVGQLSVDGDVLAQPLFVGQYQVPNKGTHNLLIVATEHNSIYAFDADTLSQMWHVNLGPSQSATDVGCADIEPEYGITSTPVINRTGAGSGTIYLVAATEPSSMSFHTLLHAVDIGTGADQVSPTEINPSAVLTNGSLIHFDPKHQMSRSALFMYSGSVYVAFSSHCDFTTVPITGWMLRFNSALQQTAAFNTQDDSAGNSLASVWMSGYPSAVDANGNIYFATGNGPFDANTGGKNYGESVLKLSPDLSAVASYFTPQNYATLNDGDLDFGSGGVMLLPGSTDMVARGKDGRIFLLSETALGGLQTNDAGALQVYASTRGIWGGPAYYVGPTGTRYVYYQGDAEPMRAFVFNGSQLSLSSSAADSGGYGGSSPVVSSNGSQTGTGVLWVAQRGSTVHLEAYDVTNMQNRLFLGTAGTWPNPEHNPFVSPLVANGRVYVGASRTVTVFGLR